MAQISGAGTPVDIKLGQVPMTTDPQLKNEFQQIYNSLHILSQYLEVLRAGLEGSDSQTPAENIRFLKTVTRPARQKIVAGNVVSFDFTDGHVIKGTNYGAPRIASHDFGNGTSALYVTGMVQTFYGIAQKDAEIGELVPVGIGPGILKVTGAISGNLIWAMSNRGIINLPRGDDPPVIYGYSYGEDGNLYLNNPGRMQAPGYPQVVGITEISSFMMPSPIGVAVANDYVLFSDFLPWNGPGIFG